MKLLGKFRGVVADAADPLQSGRLRAIVPGLADGPLGWAHPCLPGAGPNMGLFAVPPVGASVWIEFEGGDLDRPIWTGGFWHAGEAPVPAGPSTWSWSRGALRILLSEAPGAERIELRCGNNSLTVSAEGVAINGAPVQP